MLYTAAIFFLLSFSAFAYHIQLNMAVSTLHFISLQLRATNVFSVDFNAMRILHFNRVLLAHHEKMRSASYLSTDPPFIMYIF